MKLPNDKGSVLLASRHQTTLGVRRNQTPLLNTCYKAAVTQCHYAIQRG